ncbi:MAG: hypothetical protein VYE77_11390 [Planctomycetota bacterium]|nr:hypothetical protein [Planctomycetota bacterium]
MRYSGLYAPLLLSSLACAQADIMFTMTQNVETIKDTPLLKQVKPNEVIRLLNHPGPDRSEKWAPRPMFHANAGDEDGDDNYWEPTMLSQIDALLSDSFGTGPTNPRDMFFSPSVPMGTNVSGGPGLRPGDVGRIRKLSGLDGQVEYFITAEQIALALGLPPGAALVNVDAISFQPNVGVMFSLEDDFTIPTPIGSHFYQDGDVFLIPPGALTLSGSGTIATVMPHSAVVAYSEADMDALVANANVTNRFNRCLNRIIDTDALEIDLMLPIAFTVPTMFGPVAVPHVLFAGESMTGGAILDSNLGGQIRSYGGSLLGNPCGSGATLGRQLGLQNAFFIGIRSSVNALMTGQVCTFVTETPTPQLPRSTPTHIDWHSPVSGMSLQMMLVSFVPSGPGAVPVSAPSLWGGACYPDLYLGGGGPHVLGSAFGPGEYGTWPLPPIPFAADLLFQMLTLTGSSVELSTPTIIEVF